MTILGIESWTVATAWGGNMGPKHDHKTNNDKHNNKANIGGISKKQSRVFGQAVEQCIQYRLFERKRVELD